MRAIQVGLVGWFLTFALPALAQSPHDIWRTVQTEHYRVHYPIPLEAFALFAAERLDGIRERVSEEVGYAPPQLVDVLVIDPLSDANGMALPLLGRPRMVLYASSPEAHSGIGSHRGWLEMLAVHEDTHLVHLLRPSRNGFGKALGRLGGAGPVTVKAPRWVSEGYATVVEGRLTGAGRPNSHLRAAVLRRWSLEGEMPSYDELDGSSAFMGGSMAYLAGSAYLEWLEARGGEGSLNDLWARMSAKEARSFEAAFEGIFGDDPRALYGRFVAELTHDAVAIAEIRPPRQDTLWLDTSGWTGAPAVSPHGDRVAFVQRMGDAPPRLEVWFTAIDDEAITERQEANDEMLALDPDDVAAVRSPVPPHDKVATRTHPTRRPVSPRWTPDGEELVFAAWTQHADGRRRPDLWAWSPDTGEERRITRGEDIREADPIPGTTQAIGVRHRWGLSELVRVDLDSGEVDILLQAPVGDVFGWPRVAPDGDQLSFMVHEAGAWRLRVGSMDLSDLHDLNVPYASTIATPSWAPDGGSLLVSLGHGGLMEIGRLRLDGAPIEILTQGEGAAVMPDASHDGRIYYLELGGRGYELRSVVDRGFRGSLSTRDVRSAVVRRPPAPAPPPVPAGPLDRPRAYGLGRAETRPLAGLYASQRGIAVEGGVFVGDLVGRHGLTILGTAGAGIGVLGGRASLLLRPRAIDVEAQVWAAAERELAGWDRWGAELGVGRGHSWTTGRLDLRVGTWMDAGFAGGLLPRVSGFGAAAVVQRIPFGRSGVEVGLALQGDGGLSGTGVRSRGAGTARLAVDLGPVRAASSWTLGAGRGPQEVDGFVLGGSPVSSRPGAAAWGLVRMDGVAMGRLQGQHHDRFDASLGAGSGAFELFVRWDRMWDLEPMPKGALTWAGLRSTVRLGAQPLAGFPPLEAHALLACPFQTPEEGITGDHCRDVGGWILGGGLSWRTR